MKVFAHSMHKMKHVLKELKRHLYNLFSLKNVIVSTILLKRRGNVIQIGKGTLLKDCKIRMVGGGNLLKIGEYCRLKGVSIFMDSGNKMFIGDRVVCNASNSQRTRLNSCGGTSLTIGDNCLLSNNVEIHTTDYHKIFHEGALQVSAKPVDVGNNCWIGLSSIILKGVHLGPNCVVGAGSVVVNSEIGENCIVAGNPAKIVKKNIDWQQ